MDAVTDRRLGRLPAKSSRKALQFADFFQFLKLPPTSTYWQKKPPLPLRTFGNNQYGDCTRAKQAVAIQRMERLEQRKLVEISDAEVIRVYTDMSTRLYGGGDNGAYEEDALNEWRRPDTTIHDVNGHPYTIDAFLRVDAGNHEQLKAALALAGAKGIAVCFNLPSAFQAIEPPQLWDVPRDQPLIGPLMPGTWGGHSMWANGYTKQGVILDHTWNIANQVISWDAMAAYCDEAHLIIDSVDSWRQKTNGVGRLKLNKVIDAVNAVSSYPTQP